MNLKQHIRKIIFLLNVIFILPSVIFSQPDPEWISRYNGNDSSFDILANIEMDNSGNLYVYGSSNSVSSLYNFVIVKYNSSGNQIWKADFNGEGNSTDQILRGIVDTAGNSYVTGFTTDITGKNVLVTAMYDSSGELAWMKFFSHPDYTNCFGQDITIDGSGNIIVCGFIRNLSGTYDMLTLKYSDNGAQLNSVIYNGAGNGDDLPVTVKTDSFNNILLTANSKESASGADIIVVKYDPAFNLIWKKVFSGGVDSDDKALSSVINDDNSVIISGSLRKTNSSYDYFFAKISQTGNVEWEGTFNGFGNYIDLSSAIVSDDSGNTYITGVSYSGTINGTEDILTLKISPVGNVLWSSVFNGQANGTDQGMCITTDQNGNVYVGGGSDRGNVHLEYTLLKYDPAGNLLWKKNYENPGISEDFISGIIVDSKKNIFVSGISIGENTNFDIVSIKYSQTTGIINYSDPSVNNYSLSQNYPNPFNPITVINYTIPDFGNIEVEFKIYDSAGKEIMIFNEGIKSPGSYEFKFDGSELSSGIYYYSIRTSGAKGDFVNTKKMILLK